MSVFIIKRDRKKNERWERIKGEVAKDEGGNKRVLSKCQKCDTVNRYNSTTRHLHFVKWIKRLFRWDLLPDLSGVSFFIAEAYEWKKKEERRGWGEDQKLIFVYQFYTTNYNKIYIYSV